MKTALKYLSVTIKHNLFSWHMRTAILRIVGSRSDNHIRLDATTIERPKVIGPLVPDPAGLKLPSTLPKKRPVLVQPKSWLVYINARLFCRYHTGLPGKGVIRDGRARHHSKYLDRIVLYLANIQEVRTTRRKASSTIRQNTVRHDRFGT
jgi:hypothetical protein